MHLTKLIDVSANEYLDSKADRDDWIPTPCKVPRERPDGIVLTENLCIDRENENYPKRGEAVSSEKTALIGSAHYCLCFHHWNEASGLEL